MTILLSIITVNLNNAKNLQRTINSLQCAFKHSQIECLFVDGKSNDKSVEIACEFYPADLIISESDEGIYDAMNKGLFRARGSYLLWLNSGDELFSEVDLDGILHYLRQSSADLISGKYIRRKHPNLLGSIHSPNVEHLPWGTLPHPATFFKKVTAINAGGYIKNYKVAADRALIVSIYLAGGSIEIIPQTISVFYLDGISSKQPLVTMREDLKINLLNNLIGRRLYFFGISLYLIRKMKHSIRATAQQILKF